MSEALEALYVKLARAFRIPFRKGDETTAQLYAAALARMPAAEAVVDLAIERYEKFPTIAALNKLAQEMGADQVLRVDQYLPVIRKESAQYAALRRRLDEPGYTQDDALVGIGDQAQEIADSYGEMGLGDVDDATAFRNRAKAARQVRMTDASG